MQILMVCASAPTRERPRANGFLAAVARGGHAVSLLFVDRAGTVFDDLAGHCARIGPVRRAAGLEPALQAELAARPFDLIHLDGPAACLLEAPLGLPTVVDVASCGPLRRERATRESGPLLRIARAVQAARAGRCHVAARAHGAHLLVATAEDAWAFRATGLATDGLSVVPSLVDLERFAPPTALRDQERVLLDLRGLGAAEAAAAMRLAARTLALAWAQRPELRLTVLGRAPFGGAGRLAGDPRVSFTGPTGDPRGHLARAALVFAPVLPGGGPAHGPLEAMATGAAVVGPPALARELGAAPGHELAVAASSAGWAQAILGLLDDPPYRGRMGRAGRRLVELRHSPAAVTVALENIYAAAVGAPLAAWRLEVGLG